MHTVGLVGHIGAGKTSIAKYLESKGYMRVTLSDFLVEEARSRGLPASRKDLQDLGDELRQRNGGSFLVRRALEKASQAGTTRLVIDGLRNPDEVRALKETGNATLLGVSRPNRAGEDVDPPAADRERTPNEPPWGQRVADSMPLADLVVENAGALEDLYLQVSTLLLAEVGS